MGPVYGRVCLLSPRLSLVLISPTHEAMARLCLPEWLHTQIAYQPANGPVIHPSTNRPDVKSIYVDRNQRVTIQPIRLSEYKLLKLTNFNDPHYYNDD